jgi:hypothetical protein
MAEKSRPGRRYPLLVYKTMINLWWPKTLVIGLVLAGLGGFLFQLEAWRFEPWRGLVLMVAGGLCLLATVGLLILRSMSYVQPYSDHLRLVTPFLQVRLSYKRVQKTTSVIMSSIFPPRNLSFTQRDFLEPLLPLTALLIELNGLPVSQQMMRRFISPYLFKDKTPHVVLLVADWMKLSGEIETLRFGGEVAKRKADQSILSRLPQNRP